MDRLGFIEYSVSRYGIDFSTAETFTNMFNDCMVQLIKEAKKNHTPMHFRSKAGDAVILSKDDYESLKKTA